MLLYAYVAASWGAIAPLSEQLIAIGSEPMAFPDVCLWCPVWYLRMPPRRVREQ